MNGNREVKGTGRIDVKTAEACADSAVERYVAMLGCTAAGIEWGKDLKSVEDAVGGTMAGDLYRMAGVGLEEAFGYVVSEEGQRTVRTAVLKRLPGLHE